MSLGSAFDSVSSTLPKAHPGELATGGADRIRTDDPLVANQVLSQLSYSPEVAQGFERRLIWWA